MRNKIKLLEDKDLISKYNISYNFEKSECENDSFILSGWLFSSLYNIDSLEIKLLKDNVCIYNFTIPLEIKRKDVYDLFKVDFSKDCGFMMDLCIETYSDLELYIQIKVNNEFINIFTGNIKIHFINKIKNIVSKLNKENIRRGLYYLKRGKVNNIIYGLTRPQFVQKSSNLNLIDIKKWFNTNINNNNNYENAKEFNNIEVDIIIPVYNGYKYLDKLFNSLKHTSVKYNLIVINDKSTDSKINEYFEGLKKEIVITYVENIENLGFVKTVNKGLKLSSNNVVILNTDVELPNLWLERLIHPIINDSTVASSTPFTNSGTICSFPNIGEDNEVFLGLSCQELDFYFKNIVCRNQHMPTGVGFCMGMSRRAINEIGYLNEEIFNKGYGEENDWCQRAISKGFKNVMVENLFVFHNHGGSFSSEDKLKHIAENSKKLLELYPKYNIDVAKHFELDSNKDIREYLTMKVSSAFSHVILVFNHILGGGADDYIKKLINDKVEQKNNIVMMISYDIYNSVYTLDYFYKKLNYKYKVNEFDDIEFLVNEFNIKEFIVNELVTYPNIYEVLKKISALKEANNIILKMLVHDYFCICPSVNLLNNDYEYCNIPNNNICDICFNSHDKFNAGELMDIKMWRSKWNKFLLSCDNIICFSNSSKGFIECSYNINKNIEVIPHNVDYINKVEYDYLKVKILNIAILGTLSYHKGLKIIKEIIKIIEKDNLDIKIFVFGEVVEPINSRHLKVIGKYKKEELPSLMETYNINFIFIPSIWPETFSFTTEEGMNMSLPVATFNLGAPAERVCKYGKGLIISDINATVAIKEISEFYKLLNN